MRVNFSARPGLGYLPYVTHFPLGSLSRRGPACRLLAVATLLGALMGPQLLVAAPASASTTIAARVGLRQGASAYFPGSPWAVAYSLSADPASGDQVELDYYENGAWSVWENAITAHRTGVFSEDWRQSGSYTWRAGFTHGHTTTYSSAVTVHVVSARTATYTRPSTKILSCTSSRRADGGINFTLKWTVSGGTGYSPPGTFQGSGAVYNTTAGENTVVFYTKIRYASGARLDVIHNVWAKESSSHTCVAGTIHYT